MGNVVNGCSEGIKLKIKRFVSKTESYGIKGIEAAWLQNWLWDRESWLMLEVGQASCVGTRRHCDDAFMRPQLLHKCYQTYRTFF